jgi:hypothetical protein
LDKVVQLKEKIKIKTLHTTQPNMLLSEASSQSKQPVSQGNQQADFSVTHLSLQGRVKTKG